MQPTTEESNVPVPASDPEIVLISTSDQLLTATDEPVAPSIVVISSRGGDGLGISFKVHPNGGVFRVEPARDPNQPRFWCFRVHKCTSAGIADENERSWWGAGGMSRNDLPEAVQAIRDDPAAWLENEALGELRHWIMQPNSESIPTGRLLGSRRQLPR